MIVRKLRLARGWSQEELAQACGLSVRTVQRIERGQTPSLETRKALASVFETDIALFTEEDAMLNTQSLSAEEEKAMLYVRDIKGFYNHLIIYCLVIGGLFLLNFIRGSHLWAIWPALGWGIGIVIHGMNVFELCSFLGPKWEKRQIEKRLKRSGLSGNQGKPTAENL